jgi:hypothetical protein
LEVDYENDDPIGLTEYKMVNSGFGIGVTFRF